MEDPAILGVGRVFPAAPAAAAAHDRHQPPSHTFKLPEFWIDEPEMWFRQAEGHFRRHRITDQHIMYDCVLVALPAVTLKTIRDVVRAADDAADPYTQIKRRLLGSFAPSTWQLVYKIIHHPQLGDLRPSQLMDSMMALLPPDDPPGLLFQGLFLERLPAEMRDILSAGEFDSPRELAEQADKIWDARQGRADTAVVAAIREKSPGRSGRSYRRQSPGRRGRDSTPGNSSLCFYHRNFGKKAHQCRPPCEWTGNGEAATSGGN